MTDLRPLFTEFDSSPRKNGMFLRSPHIWYVYRSLWKYCTLWGVPLLSIAVSVYTNICDFCTFSFEILTQCNGHDVKVYTFNVQISCRIKFWILHFDWLFDCTVPCCGAVWSVVIFVVYTTVKLLQMQHSLHGSQCTCLTYVSSYFPQIYFLKMHVYMYAAALIFWIVNPW